MPSLSGVRSRKWARNAIHEDENEEINENDDDGERREKTPSRIGFRHWLLTVFFVALVYLLVVFLDNRLPEVLPSTQFVRFSETRARISLNKLASFGPRPSGSNACEIFYAAYKYFEFFPAQAVSMIVEKLRDLRKETDLTGVNRLEIDIQQPSGCFDLGFLSTFSLCYKNITNIVARFGRKSPAPANYSILVNCHFDSLPDSPGATDDAVQVSCAIMLEMLEVYSRSYEPFENDVILLFNGAEENFLQASHGFISKHRWRHSIRAFLNLEGAGAGGRELLFQAGPGNSWLLKAYLDNAPYPHCSVLAQICFSGLDVAYVRNGWLYHTEFDRPEFIPRGAIQRAGENTLMVVRALVRSPYLAHPGQYHEGRWVFYDVVGLFTVCYSLSSAVLFNYLVVFLVFLRIVLNLYRPMLLVTVDSFDVYTIADLMTALLHHLLAMTVISATGLSLVAVVGLLDLDMVWYKTPEIIFALYFLPCFLAGLSAHGMISRRYFGLRDPFVIERAHFDSMLVIFSVLLAWMTAVGWASAFFLLIHVIFPLFRDLLYWVFVRIGSKKTHSAIKLLLAQLLCLLPVVVFSCYAVMLSYDVFVPIMGRIGNAFNPELMVMAISVMATFSFILYTSNLLYISRSIWYLIKCGIAVFLLFLVILLTTRLGEPYSYSATGPRLRRVIILHTSRSFYGFDGQLEKTDSGLFIQTMDYRGPRDLPDHTFLQGIRPPDCSRTQDEYCQLPYYTAIHELFPPEESRWVPQPSPPPIRRPLSVRLLEKTIPNTNLLNLTISIDGGTDKISLHVTPINGYRLVQWSFTSMQFLSYRPTHFVFLTYGRYSGPWIFWLLLEYSGDGSPDPDRNPSLELSVATHYAHGPDQYSEILLQVRRVIDDRRAKTNMAIGWWRWAMAHICGVSELVSALF